MKQERKKDQQLRTEKLVPYSLRILSSYKYTCLIKIQLLRHMHFLQTVSIQKNVF